MSVLCYWLNCSFPVISEFIFSTSCLLSLPSSFFDEFIKRHIGLERNLSLWSLSVTKASVLAMRLTLSLIDSNTALEWSSNITDKSNCSFTLFDMKEFSPSITKSILHQTVKFAKQHTNINKNDLRIIDHCRKSPLFSDNKTWKKKSTDSYFDV